MNEPTIAEAIKDLHRSGWYTTFRREYRSSAERATSSTELLRLVLSHIRREAAHGHVRNYLRERCKPILDEARQKGCLFYKCHYIFTPESVKLTFNNGVDTQYTRSIGYLRFERQYGVILDMVLVTCAVRNVFVDQDDFKPMEFGLSRKPK